jgi:hypothetical protein
MDKIILPLVEGFAPAFVVLDYIRRQRDADQAILDKALRERTEEIFRELEKKNTLKMKTLPDGKWGLMLTVEDFAELWASYLGGK